MLIAVSILRPRPPLPRSCRRPIAPVWDHVLVLVTGAVLTPGKRTVSAVLRIMGLVQIPAGVSDLDLGEMPVAAWNLEAATANGDGAVTSALGSRDSSAVRRVAGKLVHLWAFSGLQST